MQKKIEIYKNLFGLIGYPLSHSFSKKHFAEKFQKEGIEDSFYDLFPLAHIDLLPDLFSKYKNLSGLNVTIPYKQAVLPFLDEIDEAAMAVGAVNTISIKNGKKKGYNTDVFGFEQSLLNLFKNAKTIPRQALILGTGGAAKAVVYVLNSLNIDYELVSRRPGEGKMTYEDLNEKIMFSHPLIINTSPLGMSPNFDTLPPIPYQYIGATHLLFDLVYNPAETAFLKKGIAVGATISNGLEMLHLQAEKSWSIWNTKT